MEIVKLFSFRQGEEQPSRKWFPNGDVPFNPRRLSPPQQWQNKASTHVTRVSVVRELSVHIRRQSGADTRELLKDVRRLKGKEKSPRKTSKKVVVKGPCLVVVLS
jgi:hypothetical protein